MPLRPLYYDTETTGRSPESDRIVEIAFYDPILDRTYLSFVNPERPIPAETTAIHHITDEMVADAPTFKQITEELIKFCEGETVLIAHNNDAFDMLFLQNEFKRAEVPFPNWKFLDTLKWARKYRPDLPNHRLQFLRETYAIPENQAHRALDDVIVLSRVFSSMVGDLPFEVIMELITQQSSRNQSNTLLTVMPFGKHQGKALADVPIDYLKWMHSSGLLDKPDNSRLKNSIEQLGLLSASKS
ncbi:MAG: hypothetical protein K0S74_965 [Chlamydiales bacterium]|jgi:DNA polymerase-3 subunit epsilon|nr:hypothetical protein [Chlamydiales bacterium]